MANLADIDPVLLDKGMKPYFMEWIRDLPVDNFVRKELMLIWAEAVATDLTRQDFIDFAGGV